MEIWKLIHISCAFLSISGFGLRGYWMLSESELFNKKPTKILPHIIDTLLLVSAVGLLISLQLNPLDHVWVMAKIIALILYIALGLVAFRLGKNKTQRTVAWIAALLIAAYIVQTAVTKNPWVI